MAWSYDNVRSGEQKLAQERALLSRFVSPMSLSHAGYR
jgi:hypothetical protein